MLDNTNSQKGWRIRAGDGRTGRAEEFWDKVTISHGAHLSGDIIKFAASFIKEGQKYTQILQNDLYYIHSSFIMPRQVNRYYNCNITYNMNPLNPHY